MCENVTPMPAPPDTRVPGSPTDYQKFAQVDRKAMELWARLISRKPAAAQLLMILVARMGELNAVVVSQKVLAKMMQAHERTVRRAVADLVAERYVEVLRLNGPGTVSAYVVNSHVAWGQPREDLRLAIFTATVIAAADDQPDREVLGKQEPLHVLPSLFPGERQLPTGDGLPPPSEPALPGMELDLPALVERERGHGEEPVTVGQIIAGLGLKGDA